MMMSATDGDDDDAQLNGGDVDGDGDGEVVYSLPPNRSHCGMFFFSQGCFVRHVELGSANDYGSSLP